MVTKHAFARVLGDLDQGNMLYYLSNIVKPELLLRVLYPAYD
jgi:hypothetical protein